MNTIFLAIFFITAAGGYFDTHYYPMSDMETCLEAVDKAKVEVPSGGDAESSIAMFCTEGKLTK
jgi:hypothetical protein